MTITENPERDEHAARQKEIADQLKSSGALNEIFAKMDAGQPPTGDVGLWAGSSAALGGGLETELTDHLGYEKDDVNAPVFSNSRNGASPKTVATEVADIDLAVPRGRQGSFTPMLVPKGSRRLDGLDGIISLHAGGMTIRDIQHHRAWSTAPQHHTTTVATPTSRAARR